MRLQDTLPPVPYEAIHAAMTRAFGRDPANLFQSIDPVPVGAASIASAIIMPQPDRQLSGREPVGRQPPHLRIFRQRERAPLGSLPPLLVYALPRCRRHRLATEQRRPELV